MQSPVVRAVGWMIFVIYVLATIGGIARMLSKHSANLYMDLIATVLCIPIAVCGLSLALQKQKPPSEHKATRVVGWILFVGYGAALVIIGYGLQADQRIHSFGEMAPLISCGATAAGGLWIALTKRTDRC
jgi:hypothetical protein